MFVGRGPTLLAATLTALLWNFCFVPPLFTFRITGITDLMLFCTYFVVALAMGHLAARLRAQQAAERRREQRATALYLLTRELAQASDFADLLAIIIREVGKATQAEVALSLPEETQAASLTPYFASTWAMAEKEQSVASWAFLHRQPAGRGTDTLPSAEGLHLPLLAGERAVGVLSLRFRDPAPLPADQRDLLDAFVRQIALVLDRQRLRDAEQQAKLVAESERLSKTLLNSISHEIRTPIAAITSAASNLARRAGRGRGVRADDGRRDPGGRPAAQSPGRQLAQHDPPGIRARKGEARLVRRGGPGPGHAQGNRERPRAAQDNCGDHAGPAARPHGLRSDAAGPDESVAERRRPYASGHRGAGQCRRRGATRWC